MHDIVIGFVFVAMLFVPALVAMRSGSKEDEV